MVTDKQLEQLVEAQDAPVLLMQSNPRQVVTANRQALALFGKQLHEVEGHRGGEVFDCEHSFSAAGCGKDVHCEPCKIRQAIVDTFDTGTSHAHVAAELEVRKAEDAKAYALQISTEKRGDLELVRIERFQKVS